MKIAFLLLILATSAFWSNPGGPFYSPVTGFSGALVPILTKFEKARIETTLRGFIARADSFPGFRQSEMDPSEHGIYLNVAVRDASEVKALSDRTERHGAVTHRMVEIPPPEGGDQALVIELDSGRDVPPEVMRALDKSIRGVIEYSKRQRNK